MMSEGKPYGLNYVESWAEGYFGNFVCTTTMNSLKIVYFLRK
jgi:hypothetical protein